VLALLPIGPAIGFLLALSLSLALPLALALALTLVALVPLMALSVVRLTLAAHPLGDHVAVAHRQEDLDLVQLVPLGIGALPLRDGQELLEACAG
jgi:hypothetical protein